LRYEDFKIVIYQFAFYEGCSAFLGESKLANDSCNNGGSFSLFGIISSGKDYGKLSAY
jgi:hypothetical protein